MAKRILGLSAYYHDSAAALVVDGEIVAAAQEERFTRKKHDAGFPAHAARWCLKHGGVDVSRIDAVAFYDKPLLKFERLFETYLELAPRGFRSFLASMPLWMREKLWMKERIREELGFEGEVLFAEHHESHAASAFYPSPFEEAAVLTMDGVGEWATSSIGHGKGASLDLLRELRFPHSVGLLYSAFTFFCGFKVNSGEYKLMGLAPYGEPRFADAIRKELVEVHADGSIRLDLDKFEFARGLTMTGRAFERLFGGPAREAESLLTQREMDLAASVQAVTEEIVLKMARHARALTGARHLCLAGGVALNCVANGALLRKRVFDDMVARAYERGKATNTASHFEIDEVIDPAESRARVASAFASWPGTAWPRVGKKRGCIHTSRARLSRRGRVPRASARRARTCRPRRAARSPAASGSPAGRPASRGS